MFIYNAHIILLKIKYLKPSNFLALFQISLNIVKIFQRTQLLKISYPFNSNWISVKLPRAYFVSNINIRLWKHEFHQVTVAITPFRLSPPNPTHNHKLHSTNQVAKIKKVMKVAEIVWIVIMWPSPSLPPTKKNLKLY